MDIRKSRLEDMPAIMDIFEAARAFMRKHGNHSQWINGYPSEAVILADIQKGNSYVITTGEGKVVGTFAFIVGDDPTYSYIEGEWLNDRPYGTIHRIASAGTTRGIADRCLEYCCSQIDNIRIDTHADNTVMINWVTRAGFRHCGTIYIADGTPRLAFHLTQPRNN